MSRSILTAAVVAVLGSPGDTRADWGRAEPPPEPSAVSHAAGPVANPYLQQIGWCPHCGGGRGGPIASFGGHGCKSCGKPACGAPLIRPHNKGPFIVELCPGACFGYFQTQWRRWDEVCPYPYQGVGVGDAPRPPAPYLPSPSDMQPPKKPGTLPDPRVIDPKTGMPIPPVKQ